VNPLTLLQLLVDPDFQQGFLVGAVGLVLLLVVKRLGWLTVWGAAAFVALAWTGRLTGTPDTPSWALAVAAPVVVVGTWAFRGLSRRAAAWSVCLVFALWVLGVWGTVPDTERARVPMGVAAALLLVLWPRLRVPVGWPGALVAIAALGFVTVTDGAPRTTAMVGSFGMVGMPLVAALAAARRGFGSLSPQGLVAAQVVHVIVSGRIAGQMSNTLAAIGVVIASAVVTGALVPGQRGRQAARKGPPPPEVLLPPDRGSPRPSRIPVLSGFERPRKKR
jgi:hypothetical protein